MYELLGLKNKLGKDVPENALCFLKSILGLSSIYILFHLNLIYEKFSSLITNNYPTSCIEYEMIYNQ